jgi:hypothetical protein
MAGRQTSTWRVTQLLASALRAAIWPALTVAKIKLMVCHHRRRLFEAPRKRRLQMAMPMLS